MNLPGYIETKALLDALDDHSCWEKRQLIAILEELPDASVAVAEGGLQRQAQGDGYESVHSGHRGIGEGNMVEKLRQCKVGDDVCLFHGFFQCGQVSYPIAIVEKLDGTVMGVAAWEIKFLMGVKNNVY